MYWSPIRTRLLVGMLTPAIRAKAVTPVADFHAGWFVRLPIPRQRPAPLQRRRETRRERNRRTGSALHKHKHDAALKTRPASLKNSVTGCELFTVSMAVRQPLRPRFFPPGGVFPPVGPAGLVRALPPRLATTLAPAALAFFLPRFASSRLVADGCFTDVAPDVAPDLTTGRTPDLTADLPFALVLAAAAGLRAPARGAITRPAGLRALRRCAALRAATVRGATGRRRADIAATLSASWSKTAAAMAALTFSTGAIPSTVLSAPLWA